jgi:hypothetical protein
MRRGAHFTDNIVRVGLNYHSTHLIAASAKTATAWRILAAMRGGGLADRLIEIGRKSTLTARSLIA